MRSVWRLVLPLLLATTTVPAALAGTFTWKAGATETILPFSVSTV